MPLVLHGSQSKFAIHVIFKANLHNFFLTQGIVQVIAFFIYSTYKSHIDMADMKALLWEI